MKLTPKQVAARQSVSVGLVCRLCATRRLTHYRVGGSGRGKVLIDEANLEALMATMQVFQAVPSPTRPPPQTVPRQEFRHLKLK